MSKGNTTENDVLEHLFKATALPWAANANLYIGLHTADPDHRVPHLAFQRSALHDTPILAIDQVVTSFYLRLQVADEKGVLARITGILANNDISIDAVLQRESAEGERQTELIILTHDTVEGRMTAALAQMQALPTVLAPIVRIRKEELS